MVRDPHILRDEGMQHYRVGKYDEAAACFVAARDLFAAAGNSLAAAEMQNDLGVAYRAQHRWDEAAAAFTAAQEDFERLGDQARAGQVLGNLGSLYLAQGRLDQAASHLSRAAILLHQTGERQLEGDTRRLLSAVRFRQRRWLEALVVYEAALTCYPRLSLGRRLLLRLVRWLVRLAGVRA
ncbi:MAG: tetratricopeptide repeat protein [Anaerolineae bacterium]|jgi:tetratricopeptide (TPR) repeat protein|nr:tetratricopeptide repeat protein [Anaerolineae bacterium]MDH7474145.1 tetratricopeptide repeat protein [Anaerolineae bacterium]